MESKEFSLTMYGSSIRLPKSLHPLFNEFLHPEMQAGYQIEYVIEHGFAVGIRFNAKEPIEIGKKVKLGIIKVSHHRDGNLYLYLYCGSEISFAKPHMFRLARVSAKVKCKLEGVWLTLYYDESNRVHDVGTVFA